MFAVDFRKMARLWRVTKMFPAVAYWCLHLLELLALQVHVESSNLNVRSLNSSIVVSIMSNVSLFYFVGNVIFLDHCIQDF